MSIGNIIEQSIKNLDTLPATVRTNMMEIRRLDAMCQKMTLETQTKVRQLIDSWKSINKEARKKSFNALKVKIWISEGGGKCFCVEFTEIGLPANLKIDWRLQNVW